MIDSSEAERSRATRTRLGLSSRLLRIDQACDRFEADWRADHRPRIEDYLADFPTAEQGRVLYELMALELELGLDGNRRPTPQGYLARFPGWDQLIRTVFEAVSSGPTRDSAAVDEASLRGMIRANHPQGATELHAWPASLGHFGDYELLGEIARGGMGVVYRARQRSLNRIVALKMIRSDRFACEAELSRFQREAEAAANLDHPHIVPIYEIGRHLNRPYFSMKLIEGRSLAGHLPRLMDEPKAVAQLMATIARAVHEAHQQGVVHRDLKPANILIDAVGRPYITDFGLAKRIGDESNLTGSGVVVGTPDYMAPEQATGRADVSVMTDVYGLGAVLYALLTGRPPFRASTVLETVVQVLQCEPEPPSRVRPGAHRDLERICLKCLEKHPGARYASAAALADDLERMLRGEATEAGRAGPFERLRRWTRREPELVCRLLGLTAIGTLTQVNHATNPDPDSLVHYATTAVETTWLFASLLFHRNSRRTRSDRVRPVWIFADMIHLTAMLRLLDAAASSLLVGYPLLIAASGLWSRSGLVWLTTALAVLGYAMLALDANLRGVVGDSNYHPNILLAVLAVTGLVIAQQVKQLVLIQSYYENTSTVRTDP